MTELEFFKKELKELIQKELNGKNHFKRSDYNHLTVAQNKKHTMLLQELKLCSKIKASPKFLLESNQIKYMASVNKINKLLLANLFTFESTFRSEKSESYQIEILPFLIKVKKLNLPLELKLIQKIENKYLTSQEKAEQSCQRLDIFLHSYDSIDKATKEKLLNGYIKKCKAYTEQTMSNVSKQKSRNELEALEVVNGYFNLKEKKHLEQMLTDETTEKNKNKRKI